MENKKIQNAKCALIKGLEEAIGYKIATPRDFEAMRDLIFRRTHLVMSATTLKRIWGYNNEPVATRNSTFSIMARALGYRDWDDFCSKAVDGFSDAGKPSSSPVFSRSIDVRQMLKSGDTIKLLWHPNRQCVIRYIGKLRFEVVESFNTRLLPGDIFSCHLIIEGQPLYLSQLTRGNSQPMAYICGKMDGGIQFEFCPDLP